LRTLQNMNKQNISEFAKKAIDALAYIIRKIRIECGLTIGQASTEIFLEKSRLWNYENTKHSMRVETFALIIEGYYNYCIRMKAPIPVILAEQYQRIEQSDRLAASF